MILKIARTVMVNTCADPHLRLQQQTLHNLAHSRYHMLPLHSLPQSEMYNQLERVNNLLVFLMNKEEHAFLNVSLDDVLN